MNRQFITEFWIDDEDYQKELERLRELKINLIEEHDSEIRTDEARKFAEWLINSKYLGICNDGFMYDVSDSNFKFNISSIDEVLAEYELRQVKKEVKEQ